MTARPKQHAYARLVMRPEAGDWASLLEVQRGASALMPWTKAAGVESPRGDRTHLRAARLSLVEAAVEYTRGLHELALSRGVLPASQSLTSGSRHAPWSFDTTQLDASRPLVLTGHQAVVFHPGLEWKYFATAQFARTQQATSLAVVMDLDPGDAGAFLVPVVEAESFVSGDDPPTLATSERSLSEAPAGLFASARVAAGDRVDALAREVTQQLRTLGLAAAADQATETMRVYGQLAGVPLVDAHAIAQQAADRLHVQLLLPFSRMMRLEPYLAAMGWLLDDARRLHAAYNRLLEEFRTDHGIRNHANPFPSLGQRDDLRELPFWRVDRATGSRDAVWFRETEAGPQFVAGTETLPACVQGRAAEWLATQLPQGQQIVPRGALVSLLFRCVACDLFVHGTGGGTYDPFTDRLIAAYVGVAPPPYAVASGTRYLWPGWPERLAALDELAAQSRDVLHHPENYFERGWFGAEAEGRLRELATDKQATVAELRAARQAGQPGAAMGRRLEQLAADIKNLVAAELAAKLDTRLRISEATRQTLLERRWPWFYYPAIKADDWPLP